MIDRDVVKVLLIEDNLAAARLLREILKQSRLKKFSLVHVQRLQDALERINQEIFDVVLLDLTLPDSQGLDSLAPLQKTAPSLPIVVLTNTNDDQLAMEAVRQGAQDYLVKREVNVELLVRSLCYAIERKQVSETIRQVNHFLEVQVQEQSAELVKAKELNQLKSEFFSIFSHDIRNPLTTILLSTQLLQFNEQRLSQEKKLGCYQRIHSAINNMLGLLDEVLLIGKADSGKLKCQVDPLNFEFFCREIVKAAQLTTDEHELIFVSRGVFDEGLWDENLLKHILVNLINNAIKYSPTNSRIYVELFGKEETVILEIKDQGIGIPKQDQAQIFEPFIRANNVGSIYGTGLGLAIVKKCVEAHGGQISLHSQEGIGSTFTVILPVIT